MVMTEDDAKIAKELITKKSKALSKVYRMEYEDLVNEGMATFLEVYNKKKGRPHPHTVLKAIHNKYSYIERKARHSIRTISMEDLEEYIEDPRQSASMRNIERRIDLKKLDDKLGPMSTIVLSMKVEGYTDMEIADALRVSRQNVSSHIGRIRKVLNDK